MIIDTKLCRDRGGGIREGRCEGWDDRDESRGGKKEEGWEKGGKDELEEGDWVGKLGGKASEEEGLREVCGEVFHISLPYHDLIY